MAGTAKTTTPQRRQQAAKPAAKPAAAKPDLPTQVAGSPAAEEVAETLAEQGRVQVNLIKLPDTKNFSVFSPPEDSGCVGKFYAPLGTQTVKVLLLAE